MESAMPSMNVMILSGDVWCSMSSHHILTVIISAMTYLASFSFTNLGQRDPFIFCHVQSVE